MVHTFIPLNNAIIKSNYPIKRIEPVLKLFFYLKKLRPSSGNALGQNMLEPR